MNYSKNILLELLWEANEFPIILFDTKGDILYFSEILLEYLGYAKDFLTNIYQINKFITPNSLSEIEELIQRNSNNKLPLNINFIKNDNSHLAVEFLIGPLIINNRIVGRSIYLPTLNTCNLCKENFNNEALKLKIITDISHTFTNSTENLKSILQKVTEIISINTGDFCIITTINQENNIFEPTAFYFHDKDISYEFNKSFSTLNASLNNGLLGKIVREGSYYLLNNFDTNSQKELINKDYWEFIEKFKLDGFLIVPIINNSEPVGTLGVARISNSKEFTEDDVEFYKVIANRLALSVSNQYLIDKLKENQEKLETALENKSQELIYSLEKFKYIFENLSEGSFIIDFDWNFQYVNKEFANLINLNKENLIGKSLIDIFPGIEDSEIYKEFEKSLIAREKNKFISSFYLNNENNNYYSIISLPINEGIFVMISDITNNVIKEKELNKWYEIFANTELGIFITSNDELTFDLINPALAKIHDYTVSELIGKSVFDIIHPEKINYLLENIEIADMQHSNLFEIYSINKNGEPFISLLNITTIINSDLSKYRIFSVQDVTNMRLIEAQNTKLVKAVENISDIVYITDVYGVIEYVNRSFEAITGYQEYEVIGRKANILKSNKHDPDFYNDFWQKLITEGSYNGVLINKKKNGEIYYEEKTISAIKDNFGNTTHYVSVGRDITERLKFQEELNRINEELEEKVRIRTIELENAMKEAEQYNKELVILNNNIAQEAQKLYFLNEKLAQSEQELKEALETKDKLFSIIAHDLLNPFVSLLNMSEHIDIYYDRINDDDKRKIIKNLKEASKNTYTLINNLLQWARAQVGKLNYFPTNFNLNEAINSVINIMSSQANAKKISVIYHTCEKSIVYADIDMVQTVLRNLISNAIKFSFDNSTINISASNYNENNILIKIQDSGIGISEDIKNNLFKINKKKLQLGTNNEKGTGLGLILCKEFVEKNGGKIWVESQVGLGTSFFFTLPMEEN